MGGAMLTVASIAAAVGGLRGGSRRSWRPEWEGQSEGSLGSRPGEPSGPGPGRERGSRARSCRPTVCGRAGAGRLGRINSTNQRTKSPKDYAFCDLLVVGAGLAGLAGAIAAAEQGLDVLVVDEQQRPGGSLAWQWGGTANAREHLDGLLEQLGSHDSIRLWCGTQAAGWYGDHWVALVDDTHLTKLRAKSMLVAAG